MVLDLGHLAGDLADDVAALVELRRVGREVRRALEAGGVLELDVRVLLGDLQGRLHEAERGREDQAVAGAGELLDGALGIGLRHALDEGGRRPCRRKAFSMAWRP